jgi:hypothetical protein
VTASRPVEYHSFSRAVLIVGEERIASLAFHHHRLATGCVMEMPARHKSGRMRGAAKGGQVISRVALRPNRRAMEWELRRLDPDTYDVKKERSSDPVVHRGAGRDHGVRCPGNKSVSF